MRKVVLWLCSIVLLAPVPKSVTVRDFLKRKSPYLYVIEQRIPVGFHFVGTIDGPTSYDLSDTKYHYIIKGKPLLKKKE